MQVSPSQIAESVGRALAEDIGMGDVTADLLPASLQAEARLICREDAVICGIPWFDACFLQLNQDIRVHWRLSEGSSTRANTEVCSLTGPARGLLSAERVALNFLQTMSATASISREYVNAVSHTAAVILDTRKTLPGLRLEQKYACHIGGAQNHRMGLYDAILIKENHIKVFGSIHGVLDQARRRHPQLPLEIEVENLQELGQALEAGAKRILLDNFSIGDLKQAVLLNQGRAKLEASGGIDLDNIKAVAETGVDYISIGALTKHIKAVDFSLRITTV